MFMHSPSPPSISSLFAESARILSADYRPTVTDVIHARASTTGVHEVCRKGWGGMKIGLPMCIVQYINIFIPPPSFEDYVRISSIQHQVGWLVECFGIGILLHHSQGGRESELPPPSI